MSFLEATNTLLDVDMWQESSILLSSPFPSDFSQYSPDASATIWNDSRDDVTTMTLLTNTSQSHSHSQENETQCTELSDPSIELTPLLSLSDENFWENIQVTGESVENTDKGDDSTNEAQKLEHSSSGDETGTCSSSTATKRPYKKSKSGSSNKMAPKLQRSTHVNNNLPPCRICADAASGFHYGVNSCEACKRFFRRALKRTRHFKCKGKKNCVIKGKKSNICGYCRYSRCLATGMSKTAIKTGRYTHQKRAQDSQEVQRLGSSHFAGATLSIPEAEVTDIVRKLVQVHARIVTNALVPREVMVRRALEELEQFQLRREVFGFQDTLTPEQYDEVYQTTGLDLDERQKDMKNVAKAIDVFVYGYVLFGKGVPGFASLPHQDQANLLKLARVEVWFLGAYRGLMKDCGMFYAPNNTAKHRMDVEKFLGKEYLDYAFDLAGRLQELDLTFEEVVVLKAVCLTFGDRCHMDDATKAEEIQWRMLKCLLHLLHKNHPEEPTIFYKVVDSLVALRNLTELSRKALANSHFTEAIRNNATLFDFILV